jgi:hypothetical protein
MSAEPGRMVNMINESSEATVLLSEHVMPRLRVVQRKTEFPGISNVRVYSGPFSIVPGSSPAF